MSVGFLSTSPQSSGNRWFTQAVGQSKVTDVWSLRKEKSKQSEEKPHDFCRDIGGLAQSASSPLPLKFEVNKPGS